MSTKTLHERTMRTAATVAYVLMLAPALLRAQRTAVVRFPSGGPGTDGYSAASVSVEYSFMACDGELWITMGSLPATLSRSSTYWYRGKQHPVPNVNVDYSSMHVQFAGDVIFPSPQGPQRVATVNYQTGPAYSSGCFNAINFQSLTKMSSIMSKDATAQQRSAFVSALYVTPKPAAEPLKSLSVESAISSQIADAAAAVASAERARVAELRQDSIAKARAAEQRAAAERATAERAAAQQRATTNASAQNAAASTQRSTASTTSTSAATAVNAAQAEAARKAEAARQAQAARDAEAQRQAAARAEAARAAEAQRLAQDRQQEQDRQATRGDMANTVSGIAAATLSDGNRFGVSYASTTPKSGKAVNSMGILINTGGLSYLNLSVSTSTIEYLAADNTASGKTPDIKGPITYSIGAILGSQTFSLITDDFGIAPVVELGVMMGDDLEEFGDMWYAGGGLLMSLGPVHLIGTISPMNKTSNFSLGFAIKL